MSRPTWVAFDLNGTLLDPAALLGAGREEAGRRALDDAVMQAMTDTLTGEFRPFPAYLRAALERTLTPDNHAQALLDAAMKRAATLPPFSDAAEALDIVLGDGYRVAVVTNSAADAARAALKAAALDARIEVVIGADEVRAYKPDPRVYRHAVTRLAVTEDEVCLVAAHAWDVLGAMRTGLTAAWVGHREHHLLSTVPEPLLRASSLSDAARQLAAL